MKYKIVEPFGIPGGVIISTEDDLKQLSSEKIKKYVKAGFLVAEREKRKTAALGSDDIEVR